MGTSLCVSVTVPLDWPCSIYLKCLALFYGNLIIADTLKVKSNKRNS